MPHSTKTKEEKTVDIKMSVLDAKGKPAGSMTMPQELFGAKSAPQLLAQAVYVYRTNMRQGTVGVKTRSEVAGSTRKIYRQKGTGKARHGANKAPIFVGGGIAHGPKTRQFALTLSKKERKKALFAALTSKFSEGKVVVVADFLKLPPKTKALVEALTNVGIKTNKDQESTLLIIGEDAKNLVQAGNNIPFLTIHPFRMLNAYEVLRHHHLVLMQEAIEGVRAALDAEKKTMTKDSRKEKSVTKKVKTTKKKTIAKN